MNKLKQTSDGKFYIETAFSKTQIFDLKSPTQIERMGTTESGDCAYSLVYVLDEEPKGEITWQITYLYVIIYILERMVRYDWVGGMSIEFFIESLWPNRQSNLLSKY